MSDYTQVNDFSQKDALPPGTGGEKLIMGVEWDEELSAISTAIATKYDSTDLADQSAAEAGASNTVLMTPLRTLQQCLAQPGDLMPLLLSSQRLETDYDATGTTLANGVYTPIDTFTFAAEANSVYYINDSTLLSHATADVLLRVSSTAALSALGMTITNVTGSVFGAITAVDSDVTIALTSSPTQFVFEGVIVTSSACTITIQGKPTTGSSINSVSFVIKHVVKLA